jgi:hypothetical protein
MTHKQIIDFYYGHRRGLTLQKLATMSGRSMAELCHVLFNKG